MTAVSVSSRGGEARRARRRRARAMIALAAAAFLVGAIVGAAHRAPSAARALATSFAQAWAKGDYATMYSEIAPSSRRTVSVSEFADLYREALTTATASGERVAGAPRSGGG
ncbi:MAG: NTF2-like N-terminal transpeptidase domain-containing protein, partial [Solirubrobacterales bacterium]